MAIRFIVEHEAVVTRPAWDGWSLCLQWGGLTDENGRVGERGYRNIWRGPDGRLLTGRAQTRIPSKAISDELWRIAEAEGWASLLGDGADLWRRVIIRVSDVADLSASGLINSVSRTLRDAGYPDDAEVFHGQNQAGDYIFFFSPTAAFAIGNVLSEFSPQTCQQPDLGDLRKVGL